MAPETMVAAVAQKTTWNMKNAYTQGSPSLAKSERKKPVEPTPSLVLAAPNMIANPTAKKATDPTEKSIRFFMMMLQAFFARVNPASTRANPACMKKTRNAAIRVHT